MISVIGEALIDLVILPDGTVEAAALGGAPFNTARTCGRLGADVRFVGAVSRDRFGSLLATQLEADGVDTAVLPRVDLPTTLAAAELDEGGAATYRFYFEGTSAPALTAASVSSLGDVLFVGGLGLVVEPMASTVEQLVVESPPDRLVMFDVNCRPLIIPDRAGYVARVGRIMARSDIVKVSDEDLDYLAPGTDPHAATADILDQGPVAVLVTAGSDGVHVMTASGERTIPVEPAVVVDTIGAGDSFSGGFLAWWVAQGLGRVEAGDLETVVSAVAAANAVAAVVVTRRGAEPPWRHELPDDWSS